MIDYEPQERYDGEAVLTMLFHWDAQIGWSFQEYADVVRAAWTLNHSLPKGAPRFRIVATDLRPDWSLVQPGENLTSHPTRERACPRDPPLRSRAGDRRAARAGTLSKESPALFGEDGVKSESVRLGW